MTSGTGGKEEHFTCSFFIFEEIGVYKREHMFDNSIWKCGIQSMIIAIEANTID